MTRATEANAAATLALQPPADRVVPISGRHRALALATGTLALGGAAVGLALSMGGPSSAPVLAASLVPDAGTAGSQPLAPVGPSPAAAAPIVRPEVSAPVVTTLPPPGALQTAALQTRSAPVDDDGPSAARSEPVRQAPAGMLTFSRPQTHGHPQAHEHDDRAAARARAADQFRAHVRDEVRTEMRQAARDHAARWAAATH